ncbi:MAG: hypothetical protein K2Q12_03205 [Rickettsiales bacterium]|nr:hypothetical protein [Rickettsiales bacterium]
MSQRSNLRLHASGMEAFYYETTREDGELGYMYLLAPSERKASIARELDDGQLPPDVIVLEAGMGQPDARTRHEMELYYGIKDGIKDGETLAA